MSSSLRNKEFYIFNQKVSKDEYEAFLKTVDFSNYEQMEVYKKQFLELIRKTASPVSVLENCEDVEGNYVKNSKNSKRCFESSEVQDCFNIFQVTKSKNVNTAFMSNFSEKCFQCVATAGMNCQNCAFVWYCHNLQYCYLCISCQDCFGCIGLRNKKYHIFNKPYSKDDYEQRISQLIEGMKNRGEYGFFFPMQLSPFKYETPLPMTFFPNR